MRRLLVAVALLALGCAETGHGGNGGTAATGGDAGGSGSGGSSGSGGDGGSGGVLDADAEYRQSCLRDEPDTPIECLDRREGHNGRECGDKHLRYFACMNELGGNDPFEDCKPLLDDWFTCIDDAFPKTEIQAECGTVDREQDARLGGGGHRYFASGMLPENPAGRRRVWLFCDQENSFYRNPEYQGTVPAQDIYPPNSPNGAYALYKETGELVVSFPTVGYLPADVSEVPQAGCSEVRDAVGYRSDDSVWSEGWELVINGNSYRAPCSYSYSLRQTTTKWSISRIHATVIATLGSVTP